MAKSKELFFTVVTCLIVNCASYDLAFNTDRDLTQWKFNGSYLYGRNIQSLGIVLPDAAVNAVTQEEVPRVGFWLIRYSGPEADNFLRLEYALHHHLFSQALISFVASPTVPVTIYTSNNEVIGKFWSDGKKWCDAIITVNMKREIFIDILTPNSGDYALVDKIVLGVMSNLTQITERDINPCKTMPLSGALNEDDMAPDMEYKPISSRRSYQEPPPPPDMAVKPTSSRNSHNIMREPLPDMADKRTPAPHLYTNTVTTGEAAETNNNDNNNNDSSEVKCGCSCSCARVKSKKNNGTMYAAG